MRIESQPLGSYAAAGAYLRRQRVNRIAATDDHDSLNHTSLFEDYAMMTGQTFVHANDNRLGDLHPHSLEEISGPKVAFSSLALAHLMEARDSDEPFLIDPQEEGIVVVTQNLRADDDVRYGRRAGDLAPIDRRSGDRVIDMQADPLGVYQPA